MIKSFSATTNEIDDAEAAIAEILKGLDLKNNLKKNSVGIVSCLSDYEETGVLEAVCDAMPFECIGSTTCLCANKSDIGQLMLVITVLTSDDCEFMTTAIDIGKGYENSIDEAVRALISQSEIKPSLLLGCFPLVTTISGDLMMSAVERASGGIPLFGGVAIDNTSGHEYAKTIHNGKMHADKLILGAFFGDVEFSFEIASLDESKFRKQKAIITAADGNILVGVNGKPALEYLNEIGLNEAEMIMGIVPFFLDHNDGTKPVARAVFALTPEGHVVCGGAISEGATLAIGRVDKDDVLRITKELVEHYADDQGLLLIYSCYARYLTLGAEVSAEAEALLEAVGNMECHFAYSGGEVCPLPDARRKSKNYFHNYTIALCRIK